MKKPVAPKPKRRKKPQPERITTDKDGFVIGIEPVEPKEK